MRSFVRRNVITFLLFVLVVAVGVFLVPAIGPAWDEPDNIHSAGRYILFFQKGFDPKVLFNPDWTVSYFGDKIFTQNPSIYRYPPVPNYVGGVLTLFGTALGMKMTAPNIFIAFHLATVLFFALLVAVVYRFCKLLGLTTAISVLAALVTFLYPTLFGHGLSNLKDTAQTALFALSLYLLVMGSWKHIRHDIVLGAIVWGFAMATKFNAIFVPVIWILWLLVTKKTVFTILKSTCVLVIVGLATTFVVWPVLWFHPITSVSEVIKYFTTVGQGYAIFWNGVTYQAGAGQTLWWYPWVNLTNQTPFLLLFFIVIGICRALAPKKNFSIILIWLLIPLLRAADPYVAFYDGIRHFMEVLPAWIILGAIGVETLWTTRAKWLYGIVGVLIIGQLVYINWLYFPYSTGYYNAIANNPNTNFDRDIEALTVRDGMDYLHAHYKNLRLWLYIGGHLSWYSLAPGDQYVYTQDEADATILINKGSHITPGAFESRFLKGEFVLVHTITRGSAVFGWVYKRKYQ